MRRCLVSKQTSLLVHSCDGTGKAGRGAVGEASQSTPVWRLTSDAMIVPRIERVGLVSNNRWDSVLDRGRNVWGERRHSVVFQEDCMERAR